MEAYLYKPLNEKKVKCNLCSHRCVIKKGRRGICGVRENHEGVLKTLVYGKLIARHIDPIEKKPLFHFFPGSLSYSIATVGCNFKCLFCQNADIAQMPSDHDGMIMGDYFTPEDIVAAAEKGNCKSIAYTYTEPTVYFEFAYDTARIAHEKGIRNVFVTNGYMTSEALEMISPYLDAANVDLKAFNEKFYNEISKAKLKHVKETLKLMKALGIFVEVTTLLIPGLNDDKHELEMLAEFLVKSLGPETPWHISRFHPTYKLLDRPSTPLETLIMAREIGIKAGLKYVYTGNVPGENGEKTYCYKCNNILIDRWGFYVKQNFIENSKCPHCGAHIDGVGL
ncbi:MAG: AmmeMemoRadiSam system radical SAM enzyme [Proteobacteria bacterium]|nr:AmmeMemoRadiSam system radical SAM enzyme [Desulfobacteraceae bacterium]MBU3981199.1 AmmeMemoRadiSam system radical SAM enzyme [Pseudomonadota bacterium]MBU4011914.1 AmmeMemoRadiSam system radical SAM enzyme [Pseudomonadota bacterium]MBU4067497.1 AmmeMemoRadiSam system radical SAM enzyme [Pseudomonadota bacterium]MBU4102188.1 AmmeMemoRadiSam system radical SAM enzyme [Pseudomonadota bacterium]